MLYEIPASMNQVQVPNWPEGVASISARFKDGTPVNLPVLKGVNCLSLGIVGTGKTKSMTVPMAKGLLKSDNSMRAVFFEIKHTFIDEFMDINDKVLVHNPSAVPVANRFIPNMVMEIRQSSDREAEMKDLADFLFKELLDGANHNRAWIEAARDTFIGFLRVVVDLYPDNTGNRALIHALRNMPERKMLAYLAQHEGNRSMLTKDWSYDPEHPDDYHTPKRGQDIMFFLNRVLEKFTGSFYMDGEDTIHNWLSGSYGRNLFFLYDLMQSEICRPFFLYYLKKIITYKMSNTEIITAPVLLVLDEIDKMSDGGKSADFGLFQAANLGREYGLQILLTTQSIENLYGLSPDFNQHITDGGLAGFPYLVCFHPGDPKSIETMQKLYGSEDRERIIIPPSRYAVPTIKCEKEPIVDDAEFASLDIGDCIVKIMSKRPVTVHIDKQQ